jgi:hypothetical protein
VAELETHLNAPLLIRSGKGLQLTPAGRSYVTAAKAILEQLTEAERAAAGEYTEPKGDLAVTAPIMFGRMHLLPVVARFLSAFPGVAVERIKSLCGAKPPQKLRWTNAGRWAERLALWRFYQGQSESGLIIAARPGRSAWYDSRIAVGSGVFGTIDSVIWGRVGAIGCVGDRGSRWHAEARDGKGERWRRTRTC